MKSLTAIGALLALANGAAAVPATLGYDEAGNYEAAAFTNGANRGSGFGAWAFTNQCPELGDSTAGGGGDVNSTNGVSFRFMGDGTNGWCNGRRDFAAALRTGDVARFVLAYNWNGGGRGVDLLSAGGQLANLIHIEDGNTFRINGQTVSTVWAPQAAVAVEIAQETNGIRVGVVRTANGVEDLYYSTNILHAEPLAGLGFYCGGYACAPAENPNYALFANDLEIAGWPILPPPEFGPNPGPLGATAGVAMVFTVTATGDPAPVIALESTTASGGYAFAPETGALSYLPPPVDAGTTKTFSFSASNANGVVWQTVEVMLPWRIPEVVATNFSLVATNSAQLEWTTSPGNTYFIFHTPNLAEVAWSNLTPGGVSFPDVKGLFAPAMDEPAGFYCIVPSNDYLVVDLSGGPAATNYPVSQMSFVPPGGWTDEYKTTKLVLRRIPAGTFTMGSPTNELGRDSDEPQHTVTLTKDFYIGVFEVTQKQWERVMGNWPSYFTNEAYRETRPVEEVSYKDLRGTVAGTNWPADGIVDTNSFMGLLRAKTGEAFDLPTEAQWEHACRAGTTNALNSGKDLTNTEADVHTDAVGRYWYNGGSGHSANGDDSVGSAKVGSYLPNAWGLYDMHGNVWEWCLDWYEGAPAGALDPPGAASGSFRVVRGGGWLYGARDCRSAYRGVGTWGNRYNPLGFRLSRTLP